MNKNTMSPATGFAVGVGAGVSTAAVLNEANEAYERKQSKLTGINGDCSSIPCKDRLVCYKNVCLSSLPKDGCIKDSDCRGGMGQKCVNDVCIETLSAEEKQKEIQKHQEQGKQVAIRFGISFGIILLLGFIMFLYEKYNK